jgi:hypothetical protein
MAWLYQANGTAKGIQIGNEEWCHQLAIGTDWTKIRVGVRIALPTNQAFAGSPIGPTMMLGMCQGTSNIFKSATCAEFMGVGLGTLGVADFTYATSPGVHVTNARPIWVTKLNGVQTIHSTGSSAYYISATNTVRTVAFVDILKNGGTSYTVTGWMPSTTTQGTTDNTYGVFVGSMENNTTPTNANSQGAIAVTYAGPGLFDSLYFSWGKSVPALTVFDMMAARIL